MCPHGYYTIMRESKDPRQARLRMVQKARRIGIKPAARLFGCSPNTVRKWVRRFDGTLASLADHSRAPRTHPHRLDPEDEKRILRAARKLPPWSAARLKRDMELPYATKTIRRVLREHGLLRRWRRKKPQVKRSLRHIKRHWAAFQQISMDTKHLVDLPEYMAQARHRALPRYQYTARDVSTGALFLGYAGELSLTYAELFARRILGHLAQCGVDTKDVTVQTDNGSEFVGSWQAVEPSAFTRTLASFRTAHRTIPPGQHRFQADVETVHSLVELEFFLEPFRNRRDFIQKATTYQHFFNYARPNSAKEGKCPWELLRQKDSKLPLNTLYLPPLFLEELLQEQLQRVHHAGDVPCSTIAAPSVVPNRAPRGAIPAI